MKPMISSRCLSIATLLLMLSCCIWIIATLLILRGCDSAPGATPSPGLSRIGKSESRDRGALVQTTRNSKFENLFPFQDDKLQRIFGNPHNRNCAIISIMLNTNVGQNFIWFTHIGTDSQVGMSACHDRTLAGQIRNFGAWRLVVRTGAPFSPLFTHLEVTMKLPA